MSLKLDDITGAWRLATYRHEWPGVEFQATPPDVEGMLLYSAEGYMCTVIRVPYRDPVISYLELPEHVAYTGPVTLKDDSRIIHHVFVGANHLAPQGASLERIVKLTDSGLTIIVELPRYTCVLDWVRVGGEAHSPADPDARHEELR